MRFLLLVISYWLAVQPSANAQASTGSGSDSAAWHRVSLSPDASIRLPGAVKAMVGRDTAIKMFSAHNQRVVYAVVAKKLTWPTAVAAELNPDAVYQGVVQSTIDESTSGRVLRQTSFNLAGRRGLEVQLELPDQPHLAPTRYLRTLYANGWLYIYSWRQLGAPPSGPLPDDVAARNSYFATFQLQRGTLSLPTALIAGWHIGWGFLRILALLSVVAAIVWGWRSYRRSA